MGYLVDLKELRKRRGLSQAQLAERVGVEQPTVQRWEKGTRLPDLEKLEGLAKALGTTPGALLDGGNELQALGPTLFVKGDVQAGLWREAVERERPDWEAFTGRADVNAPMSDRGGMRVIGESMNVLYPHGSIIEYVKLMGGAELESGKRVIVQRERDDGEFEVTVKEYLVDDAGKQWLVPRSTHPEFQTPWRLDRPEEGIVEVRVLAVVVASVRPE